MAARQEPRTFTLAPRRGWTLGGIFRQTVGRDQWELLRKGLPERMDVQAITVHPTDSNMIFAGSQNGPYRSRDGGESWEKLPFPDEGLEVWSIIIHPRSPSCTSAPRRSRCTAATTVATAGASSRG